MRRVNRHNIILVVLDLFVSVLLPFCPQISDVIMMESDERKLAMSVLSEESKKTLRYKQELRERHDAIVKEEREKWESQWLEQQVRDVMT